MFLASNTGARMIVETFLSAHDLATLTGRKVKVKQIEALRRMGLPFFINARGQAVVSRSAIDGAPQERRSSGWKPAVVSM